MYSSRKKKPRLRPGSLLVLPTAGLLLCMTIAPLVMLVIFSFMNGNLFAGCEWPGWTLKNIVRLLTSDIFYKLMGKSLWISILVTVICIVIAYPTAWAIAKVVKEKNRGTMMMMVILPFFTSQLLLIYSMMNLIQNGGPLITLLQALGIQASSILYSNKATILVLVYEYLPYMILCLYSSLESISMNLVHASLTLGANKTQTFTHVVFPMSIPGLLSGILLVLVPVCGSFVEPALVGGSSGMMIGSLINSQYKESLNMGYGAVLSCALLVILCLIMLIVKLFTGYAQKRIGGDT